MGSKFVGWIPSLALGLGRELPGVRQARLRHKMSAGKDSEHCRTFREFTAYAAFLSDSIRCAQRSDRSTTTSLNWITGAMSV
jgi:hypothetical protein